MWMSERQLANLRIDGLERLFDEKRANIDMLTTLLAELSHRRTPRAQKLKRRVLQALTVAGAVSKPAQNVP
jgi:hypothetical protein